VYYKAEKFFAGLSATHLTAPTFNFNGSANVGLDRHYYLIGGYNYELNPSFTLTPSILYKSANFNSKATSIEGNITANYENFLSFGLGYTQQEAVNLLVGVSLLKDNSLRLGYALDLVTSGVNAKQSTSQELMLRYVLPVTLKGPKPAIRTPRYRK
jgi:type IX secretion system PorP/SprF family membrane protein